MVTLAALPPATAQVRIVSQGKPEAVVVTADKAAMVATFAAREFVNHIEKATGVRLQVVPELSLIHI